MADLILQELRDHFSEDLSQILHDERTKMFGEDKFHFNKEGRLLLGLETISRRMIPSVKRRRKTC
jgi:hypothetical protein